MAVPAAEAPGSDQELYSPTSPAESHGSVPRSPYHAPVNDNASSAAHSASATSVQASLAGATDKQVMGFLANVPPAFKGLQEVKTEPLNDVRTDDVRNTDKTTEDVEAPRGMVPQLLAGSKFDKICSLKANRWVRIGRNPKAQLLLKNSGVSRFHCSLMWDPQQKAVELRTDTSSGVTILNGERLKNARVPVAHGDKIRVQGKDINYDFLLDLRPAGLATTDPREMQGQNRRKRNAQREFAMRREELKKELVNIEKHVLEVDARAFNKEKEYYEIMSRRRLRCADIAEKEEKVKKFVTGTERQVKELKESREQWLCKIQDMMDDNVKEIAPLTADTKQVQEMLEKLQQKKIELERELHPEKYEVQKVELLDEPTEVTVPRLMARQADVDGEDEAVFDAPAFSRSEKTLGAPVAGATSPVASPAPDSPEPEGGDAEAPAAPVAGDASGGDSDDEPMAKKQKVESDDEIAG